MIKAKKFMNKKTWEIKTQIPILELKNYEELPATYEKKDFNF